MGTFLPPPPGPPPIAPGPFSKPNSYYLALVTSQYQGTAPNMATWLNDNLQYMQDAVQAMAQLLTAFDIGSSLGPIVASTAGTGPAGQNQVVVQSSTGILPGQIIEGAGIAPGTTVFEVAGTDLVLTIPTTAPLSNTPLRFYAPSTATGPVVAATTATATAGSPQMTVQNGAGIRIGQFVVGAGISPGTTVEYVQQGAGIFGIEVTLSLFTTAALINTPVSFYAPATAATGVLLDIIGLIVGQPRQVPFQPSGIASATPANGGGGYIVGDVITVVQTGAGGGMLTVAAVSGGVVTALATSMGGLGYVTGNGLATTGGSGSGLTVNITTTSPVLDDATYRTVLRCRIFQNHWDGQITSILMTWPQLFPGGLITIDDHMNMSATISIGGLSSSILQNLALNGYLVPRPEGVQYNYTQGGGGTSDLPSFGFDQNTPYVAGFDLAHFL
jgi:hypothetical protein